MFWVIQDTVINNPANRTLEETLKKNNTPYQVVKVVPFFNKLLPKDFPSDQYNGDISDIKDLAIDTKEDIFVIGATALNKIAQEKKWYPGSLYNENFSYGIWKEHLGEELLNNEAIIDTFGKIEPKWDVFFLRPCEDSKDFSGGIFEKEEFYVWRQQLEKIGYLFKEHDVFASPIKKIKEEYRFFVIDGEVTTYSQYKKEDTLYKNKNISNEVIQYVKRIVQIWQPAKAFVVDIAKTNDGYKIIEYNNINSAGFYDCDIQKIVEKIEKTTF